MSYQAGLDGKSYVLGRGRVFFDRFAEGAVVTAATQGQGEVYFGNTPEFSFNSTSDSLDHYSSEGGIKVKDSAVVLQINRSGKIMVDNISKENIALFTLGDAGTVTQTAQTAQIYTVTVRKGRYYQIGQSALNPTGVRNISNVIVKTGSPAFATTVSQAGNYDFDAASGRLYIEETSTIADDTLIQVTYDVAAGTREQIVSANRAIYGALRFLADNPTGANRDFYFPYVKLAPDGDYALKGDDWQMLGFNLDILIKGNLAPIYVDGRQITA